MFTASADLYDLVYSGFKDFASETSELADIIRRERPRARTVLDVACGSGEQARRLNEDYGYDVDGVDLDPTFVRIARGKLPHGEVHQADMISFELRRQYDVILCMFSSIAYVRTLDNVTRTLERCRHHLADGGIVLVEPWFPPGVLDPGRISIATAKTPEVSVARMSVVKVEARMSWLHFEYLIGREGRIEHAKEVHELGLFTTDEMIVCFRTAGFDATFDEKGPSGRGLFLARSSTP